MRFLLGSILMVVFFSCGMQKKNTRGYVYIVEQDTVYLNLKGVKKPLFDLESGVVLDTLSMYDEKQIGKFQKKADKKKPKFR